MYNGSKQTKGLASHYAIDNQNYSSRKNILQAIDIYTDEFNIQGKIDIFDIGKKTLIERKNKISTIYDGYIFQVYAQYFALKEMGYEVKKIKLYSSEDNKLYSIPLPNEDLEMLEKFKKVIQDLNNFKFEDFKQENKKKCENCIYETVCDRSLL